MFKKAFHAIFTGCGMLLGLGVSKYWVSWVSSNVGNMDQISVWIHSGAIVILFGLIFHSLYSLLGGPKDLSEYQLMPKAINKIPMWEFIPGIMGLILGIVLAASISSVLMNIRPLDKWSLNLIISILLIIGCGYYGLVFGKSFGYMFRDRLQNIFTADILKRRSKTRGGAVPKVFDTSVIIDGRIYEILKTGFIEGNIIIPDFVLVELQHISDSADDLKRNRGRRGLDILNAIREEFGVEIYDTSSNKDIAKIPEVDLKLLKLADILGGMVVTNDYNLNKVAGVKGIGILNINELANTLKPIALPGEVMSVTPVKEGKTQDQSVAYLDDGTMVVVQGGKKYIGKKINVTVTSVLQTSAGRMIFAKP